MSGFGKTTIFIGLLGSRPKALALLHFFLFIYLFLTKAHQITLTTTD
jgi:hypothetical protein